MINSTPLVTIAVVTYNSSQTILETLESVKEQTYKNIELIISDDCSSDNTTDICQKWLQKNAIFFQTCKLLKYSIITGVAENCNRAYRESNGKWIMFVAGDDALLPNCILDYINFSSQHPQMKICQSIGRMYKTNLLESSYIGNYIHPKHNLFYQHPNNTNWQYKVLLHWNPVAAPSVIINANIFKEIGMFNPDLPFEDWPFWLQATKANTYIFFMPTETIKYRIQPKSITNHNIKGKRYQPILFKEGEIYYKYIRKDIDIISRIIKDYQYYRLNILKRKGWDDYHWSSRIIQIITKLPEYICLPFYKLYLKKFIFK